MYIVFISQLFLSACTFSNEPYGNELRHKIHDSKKKKTTQACLEKRKSETEETVVS